MRWAVLIIAAAAVAFGAYWANHRITAMNGDWLDRGTWIDLLGLGSDDFEAATLRQARRDISANMQTGPSVPAGAEPAPNAARQVRAAAFLDCSEEAMEADPYGPLTEAGAQWTDRGTPPSELVDAANSGDPQAMYDLARGYAVGLAEVPVEEAERVATDLFQRAADAGVTRAQVSLAEAVLRGLPLEGAGPQLARDYLQDATEGGSALAPLRLAMMDPEDGEPIEAYAERRLDLELTAAERCNTAAAWHVAERLYEGRGLRRDEALAMEILRLIVLGDV